MPPAVQTEISPALAALSMQQLGQYRQYARAGSGKRMAKGNDRAFDVKL